MSIALTFTAFGLTRIAGASEPPEALRKLFAPTSQTAHITWTSRQVGGRDDGLIEHHVTQRAGTTVWETNSGDESGRHETAYQLPAGGPLGADVALDDLKAVPAEEQAGDRHYLRFQDHIWNHEAGRITASLTPIQRETTVPWPLDPTQPNLAVRSAGRGSQRPEHFGLDRFILEGLDAAKWTTTIEDGVETVTAEFGRLRLEWRLDRGRGGLPISAAFYAAEALRNWSENEIVEIDGQWRTGRSSFYMGDSTTPYRVIEVKEASFDKPWHLREITPDDMGVVFGTRLNGARIDGEFTGFWNGVELLPSSEYRRLTALYDIMPHPRIMEGIATLHGTTVKEEYEARRRYNAAYRASYIKKHGEIPLLFKRTPQEDEWDVYVKQFIEKHRLTGDRRDDAFKLLEQSKRMRDLHLYKYGRKIEEARRAGETGKVKQYEQPIQRIFEKMLKAGLEKLVRRATGVRSGKLRG